MKASAGCAATASASTPKPVPWSIWIHHEGKGDPMGPRGHLVLPDACTVWWHVEEHEDGSRIVHVAKANRGPDHVPLFAFKLVPFDAGTDRRGKTIQLCEVQLSDLDGRTRLARPRPLRAAADRTRSSSARGRS